MLTKLLFTILVLVALLLYVRQRTAARAPVISARTPRPRGAAAGRWLPAVLLLGALAVGASMFWLDWREGQRVFAVRVIDTRSGAVSHYLVPRDGLQGRSFTTVDGRIVTLADVERMEVVEASPARLD